MQEIEVHVCMRSVVHAKVGMYLLYGHVTSSYGLCMDLLLAWLGLTHYMTTLTKGNKSIHTFPFVWVEKRELGGQSAQFAKALRGDLHQCPHAALLSRMFYSLGTDLFRLLYCCLFARAAEVQEDARSACMHAIGATKIGASVMPSSFKCKADVNVFTQHGKRLVNEQNSLVPPQKQLLSKNGTVRLLFLLW